MTSKKSLGAVEISAKLRSEKQFVVSTATERQRVLTAAKFLEYEISTRKNDDGSFTVFPIVHT